MSEYEEDRSDDWADENPAVRGPIPRVAQERGGLKIWCRSADVARLEAAQAAAQRAVPARLRDLTIGGVITRLVVEGAAKQLDLDRLHRAARVLRCAFCDHEYPPGTPPTQHEALTAHVRECRKHPLRMELDRLRADLREIRDEDENTLRQEASGLREALRRLRDEMKSHPYHKAQSFTGGLDQADSALTTKESTHE